jgi:hypothetical protein
VIANLWAVIHGGALFSYCVDFGDPVSDDSGVPVWRAYRKFWLDLRMERPSSWLLAYGLYSGLLFAVIGLVSSTHWTNVLFIWACSTGGAVAFHWWRGLHRPRDEHAP